MLIELHPALFLGSTAACEVSSSRTMTRAEVEAEQDNVEVRMRRIELALTWPWPPPFWRICGHQSRIDISQPTCPSSMTSFSLIDQAKKGQMQPLCKCPVR